MLLARNKDKKPPQPNSLNLRKKCTDSCHPSVLSSFFLFWSWTGQNYLELLQPLHLLKLESRLNSKSYFSFSLFQIFCEIFHNTLEIKLCQQYFSVNQKFCVWLAFNSLRGVWYLTLCLRYWAAKAEIYYPLTNQCCSMKSKQPSLTLHGVPPWPFVDKWGQSFHFFSLPVLWINALIQQRT